MVAEVFPHGNWKSLMEVEEELTLEELDLILTSVRDAEYERQKFAAGLKGVNLDEVVAEGKASTFDEIKKKAEADLAGMSQEEHSLADIGIDIESD